MLPIRCLGLLGLAVLFQPLSLRGSGLPWPGLVPSVAHRYGTEDGLPNDTVYDIQRGPDGRLWVGTVDGAASFDGRTWRPLRLPAQARSDWVRAVLPARDGSVWCGTQDGGLWQWRAGAWIHHGAAEGLPFTRINTLLETRNGEGASRIWAGSGGQGVGVWDGRHWRILDHRNGLPGDVVWRLRQLPDPGGGRSVWVCTQTGLARVKHGRVLHTPDLERFQGWDTGDVLTGRSPTGFRAWVASWDHGLAAWNGRTWRLEGAAEGFPPVRPICLAETRPAGQSPTLWVGTYNQGLLWRRGAGGWHAWPARYGGEGEGVYSLLATGSRPDLWAGFLGRGLVAFDSQGWEAISPPPGLSGALPYCFAETTVGGASFWIGTKGGVAQWVRGTWHVATRRQGLAGNWVDSLCPTTAFGSPGLVAGGVGGLSLWQGGRWRPLPVPGLRIGEAQVLLEVPHRGRAPDLWVGTSTLGLLRFRQGCWTRIGKAQGLPAEDVFCLHETREASGPSLWVGFRGGGLARLHEGRWTFYGTREGLPSDSVYALADTRGPAGVRLWAATPGGGLGWLDLDRPGATWHVLNRGSDPDFPADTLMGLAVDRSGRLYCTSTRGVLRLTVPPGAEDRPGAWRIERFTPGDGLPAWTCISGAAYTDAAGRIWVGTLRGMACLDPARETPPPPLPALVLESVSVNGSPVEPGSPLVLGYRQHRLRLDFALPVFHQAAAVAYRTQVLGLEDRPSAWVSEGRWDLTALPAGHYALWIQARDALGRLARPLVLPVRIEAPPWRRPWAYAAYLLGFAAFVYGVFRLRTRWLRAQNQRLDRKVREGVAEIERQSADLRRYNQRLQELNEEKTRMLAMVAHDLRSPLTGILLRGQQLLEEDVGAREGWVQGILVAAGQMGALIERILEVAALDSGRARMESVPMDALAIARRSVEDFRSRAVAKGFDIELEAEGPLPLLLGDPFYFKEVLDNLVSNAVKFTPSGDSGRRVRVHLSSGQVDVADRGPGFQPEDLDKVFGAFVRLSAKPTGGEPSSGLGLSLVKTLVERMGGRVAFASSPGEGATFTVHLPLAEGAAPGRPGGDGRGS